MLNVYDTTRNKDVKKRNEADASRLYKSVLESVKGSKVDARGVVVMSGGLDFADWNNNCIFAFG